MSHTKGYLEKCKGSKYPKNKGALNRLQNKEILKSIENTPEIIKYAFKRTLESSKVNDYRREIY